jgi:hypothetical protein
MFIHTHTPVRVGNIDIHGIACHAYEEEDTCHMRRRIHVTHLSGLGIPTFIE